MSDLNKGMENQFQNLTEIKRKSFLKLLQKFEYLLDGTCVPWKIDTLDLKSKEDVNPIC